MISHDTISKLEALVVVRQVGSSPRAPLTRWLCLCRLPYRLHWAQRHDRWNRMKAAHAAAIRLTLHLHVALLSLTHLGLVRAVSTAAIVARFDPIEE